jgi:FAD/FMN-containing dehydrogenase
VQERGCNANGCSRHGRAGNRGSGYSSSRHCGSGNGSLHLDLRRFDRILDFSPADKTITVQAGARWRQIQERIDPADLSVAIMQTYANFTVGGSLSVNAHGRYVGQGPLIRSVRSLKVVLADGSEITAAPTQNAEVFCGVIGGYGGLGVITEATLQLVDNVRVRRTDILVPVADYRRYFLDRVRGTKAVFHNGDLYPDDFDTVHAVTSTETTDPVTIPDRLIPLDQPHRLHRFAFWVFSEWPLGSGIRRHIVFRDEPVAGGFEVSHDF